MKVVIIGGGIAGVSLGILLHKLGTDFVINEKESGIPARGNAFLMHADGVSILKKIMGEDLHSIELPGQFIDTFTLKRPDGTELKYIKMEPWQCMRRSSLIEVLYSLIPLEKFKKNRTFLRFLYDDVTGKAISAEFNDGTIEYGDIFVGADGSRSMVRQSLFGNTNFTPIEVKEIIGIVSMPDAVAESPHIFTKYLSGTKGLSFGYIPTSASEFVWFIQFDSRFETKDALNRENMKDFCHDLMKDFPPIVHDIINSNDFNNSYVWNATDFDLLNCFHKQNVVLIGDAAHLSVPFTSSGTTNAMVDASYIANQFANCTDLNSIESAFQKFYEDRKELVEEHLMMGREMKEKFLNPSPEPEEDYKIPLITPRPIANELLPKHKKIHLLYFTDPICSTCWLIQPEIRKLRLEYRDYLEIEYCMGGLLPSWENYQRGGISSPEDAAAYWREAAKKYEMPITDRVWNNDPILSSYPPSIAFKAAQLQDTDKALLFLRRINEILFMEGKNIVDNLILYKTAFETGLDAARLIRDLNGRAQILFNADLELAKKLSIAVLPTFIFTDKFNNSKILYGFQKYNAFESTLKKLVPDILKKSEKISPEKLFTIYPTMTTKEFSFLLNLENNSGEEELKKLNNAGIIEKLILNEKVLWKIVKDRKPQTS